MAWSGTIRTATAGGLDLTRRGQLPALIPSLVVGNLESRLARSRFFKRLKILTPDLIMMLGKREKDRNKYK
jgi:hypothetical protein